MRLPGLIRTAAQAGEALTAFRPHAHFMQNG